MLVLVTLAGCGTGQLSEEDFLRAYAAEMCDGDARCGAPVVDGGQTYDDCRWSMRNYAEYLFATQGTCDEAGARACIADARARAAGDCDVTVDCFGEGGAIAWE